MPVQTFTTNTRDSLVGNLYGISYTNSVRHTYLNKNVTNNSADIAFGLVVGQGSEDRWANLGVAGTPADAAPVLMLGLAIRQINREPDARPSAGSVSYHDNEEFSVLRDGFMTVNVASGSAVVGGRVHVDKATGEMHGSAGAGRVLATNMRWASSGAVNTNVVVEISSAIMFEA